MPVTEKAGQARFCAFFPFPTSFSPPPLFLSLPAHAPNDAQMQAQQAQRQMPEGEQALNEEFRPLNLNDPAQAAQHQQPGEMDQDIETDDVSQ
ncbi:uncharacterized protein KD926_002860 [Aspergillus affinis]|uniref:uncharacterized protein n=1 Tax=Aspergillus affinis TaxID=1070780 RepID=UPI0022FE336E|nr:uncharacterized protein KD926_002860 [Aspergillus affinis]KAI9035831.1 hypothetical protein KD926_002860 [Aspergillus affinis]